MSRQWIKKSTKPWRPPKEEQIIGPWRQDPVGFWYRIVSKKLKVGWGCFMEYGKNGDEKPEN